MPRVLKNSIGDGVKLPVPPVVKIAASVQSSALPRVALPTSGEGLRAELGELAGVSAIGRAARPRKHEDPVLPDGRCDQPEAARGCFRCAIPRLRPDSNARNARSAAPARSAGRIRLTPPAADFRPDGAALASPEIAEGQVIQRPPMHNLS